MTPTANLHARHDLPAAPGSEHDCQQASSTTSCCCPYVSDQTMPLGALLEPLLCPWVQRPRSSLYVAEGPEVPCCLVHHLVRLPRNRDNPLTHFLAILAAPLAMLRLGLQTAASSWLRQLPLQSPTDMVNSRGQHVCNRARWRVLSTRQSDKKHSDRLCFVAVKHKGPQHLKHQLEWMDENLLPGAASQPLLVLQTALQLKFFEQLKP